MGIAIVDTETVGLNDRIHGIWEVAVILHTPVVDGKGQPDEEYLWQLPVDLAFADPDALRISQYYRRRWRPPPPMPPGGFHDGDWFGEAITGYRDDQFQPNIEQPPRDDERFQVPIERMAEWAGRFAALTADRILVGAVPSFDEKRLAMVLRDLGVAPAWHYRPICVEALAVGYLRGIARGREAVREEQAKRSTLTVEKDHEWFKRVGLYEYAGDLGNGKIPLPWSHTALSRALNTPSGPNVHTALGDCRNARDLWIKIMEDE